LCPSRVDGALATSAATRAYRDRFNERVARPYFRRFGDALVSSVGVGTYLGDATDAADDRYRAALVDAVESGINVVDTAINYRHQRSERAVGTPSRPPPSTARPSSSPRRAGSSRSTASGRGTPRPTSSPSTSTPASSTPTTS
jgi:hypothetical protein